jgi:hypothetical protein
MASEVLTTIPNAGGKEMRGLSSHRPPSALAAQGAELEFGIHNLGDGSVTGRTASFENFTILLNDLFFLTNHAASGATLRAINFMHNATRMRWCDLFDLENRDGNCPVLFSLGHGPCPARDAEHLASTPFKTVPANRSFRQVAAY